MKRMIAFASALLMVCSLSSCGKDTEPAAQPESQPTAALAEATEEETS